MNTTDYDAHVFAFDEYMCIGDPLWREDVSLEYIEWKREDDFMATL